MEVLKLETGGRRRDEKFGVEGSHVTEKSYPVFGGLLVPISYIYVNPILGDTSASRVVMKCEGDFITWFSAIVEGNDFQDDI